MDQITDHDSRREIAELEDLIETLSARIAHCKKLAMAARGLVAGSGLLALAGVFGLVRVEPVLLLAIISGALGGIVLGGSNRSSAAEARAQLAQAEARRAELIGAIPLRLVH